MLWSDAFNVFSHRFLCKCNSFGHHNFMLYPLFQWFSACGHFRYGNQLLSDFYWKSFAAVATWALLAKWQRRPLKSICCHIDLSTTHSDIVLQCYSMLQCLIKPYLIASLYFFKHHYISVLEINRVVNTFTKPWAIPFLVFAKLAFQFQLPPFPLPNFKRK